MANVRMNLRVNGEVHSVHPEADDTLLTVLRDELFLTGTHRGCDQGVCGSCTILLNGDPVRACLLLARECEGAEITTIEGIASDGELSGVQKAFLAVQAPQCGFCIPGMVLTATALLRSHPHPTRDEIREAISGNLCRCTGYVKIVEAIQRAADEARSGGIIT